MKHSPPRTTPKQSCTNCIPASRAARKSWKRCKPPFAKAKHEPPSGRPRWHRSLRDRRNCETQTQQESALRASIATLAESEARAAKTEAWQNEQLASLAGLVSAAQQELTDAEDLLIQTQQWTERSRKARERLDTLEPGSLDERNCRNEIDIVSAGLRQLLNKLAVLKTQPSVIASIRLEKPASTSAPVSMDQTSDEEPSESETALQGRLAKLREAAMREESRIEFLKDERERLEKIARARSVADPAVREQEDKLRFKNRFLKPRHASNAPPPKSKITAKRLPR
jgi:hypothetical protein